MWILALDVGTSSIRAIGYDGLGRPLPGASGGTLGHSRVWTQIMADALAGPLDPEAARVAREEDDANVLCLGAREMDVARAVEITSAWLAASFSGEERFVRKVSKVALLEDGLASPEKGTPGAIRTRGPDGAPSPRYLDWPLGETTRVADISTQVLYQPS